jgi:cyanophycin synthetase
VIVDYAHNLSALAALVASLEHFPGRRRTLVFACGNRRDEDVVAMGALAGQSFDRVLVYRDEGGERYELLCRGPAQGGRVRETIEAADEQEAVGRSLADLRPGDLLVLGVEDIDAGLARVSAVLLPEGSGAGPAG